MANGSLLDQPGDRNLVDSLAGNSDNRQAMQRPHGGAAATVTYDQQAHASDPNPWVSSRVVYAFRRDVRFVCFAVVVFGSGHAGAPAVAPGRGSVPGGAVVGGDVVGGGRRVGARLVRVTRAGMWNSSRRIRATVRRARPRPSSMPVISWIQFEIA